MSLLLLFSGSGGGGVVPPDTLGPVTVRQQLLPAEAQFLPTAFPQYVKTNGSNFPVVGLAYDATVDEAAFWTFLADNYASGSVIVDLYWYADTASSAHVVWQVQLAAITAIEDAQDIETKAFPAPNFVQDTHLGTTGQRLHKASLALSNADPITAGDWCQLRISRDADSTFAADDLTGDAILVMVEVGYSDV